MEVWEADDSERHIGIIRKTKQNETSKNRGSKAFQKDRNDLRGMWTTWEEILPEETSLAFRH